MAPYEPLPVQLKFILLAMVETHGPVASITDVQRGLARIGWGSVSDGIIALNFQDMVAEGWLEKAQGEKLPTAVRLTGEGRSRVKQGCQRLNAFSHFLLVRMQWEKLEAGEEGSGSILDTLQPSHFT